MVLWRRQNRVCPWCHYPITPAEFEFATRDHWRPRSHGGPDAMQNFRLLHGDCNTQKADTCMDPQCDYEDHPAAS